jgi:hypothetical protein
MKAYTYELKATTGLTKFGDSNPDGVQQIKARLVDNLSVDSRGDDSEGKSQ